jgi:RHS repeat-associated protein
MPLARVDEAGNPVYYLTDAMGSVIGLVDGNGQEVAEFRYDSFGNLQTPEALPLELGGDFRFQGQWLESNTDLYHFRARYYDPETGRFVSRDPVEVIETVPESSNPYQFVYNNPLVYRDPSGEITISELTNARQIQSVLQGVRAEISQRAKQFLIDKAQGVAGDIIQSTIKQLLPANEVFFNVDILKAFGGGRQAGNEFEAIIEGAICNTILGSYQRYTKSLWIEPRVTTNGKPQSDGFNCGEERPDRTFYEGIGITDPRPDFIIKNGGPRTTDHARSTRYPKSYLIGDIKLSGKGVEHSMRRDQWSSIMQYAKYGNNHQYTPISLFVTFSAPRQGESRRIERAAWRHGVSVAIVPIIPLKGERR